LTLYFSMQPIKTMQHMNGQSRRPEIHRFNLKNVLILGFIFLGAGYAAAQNLATNPGFETGNTNGWIWFGTPTLTVETTQVHSGSYACLVTNRTATYMGAAQSFTSVLQSGQTYNVSAWVRLVSGASQTVYLTFAKTDGNPTSYAQAATGTASSTGWTQIAGQYTLNISGTLGSLTLYAELPNTNAAYYIDDLSVQLTNIPPPPPTNGQCTVDWSNVFQRIDGFGASSAWNGSWTTAQADMLFSTNTGCGLSLLRNHITYAGSTSPSATPTTSETSIMQMAQARGARVWSAPWTPAVGFKSTNDTYDSLPITNAVNGGTYLGSGNNATNQAYASQLANYVASMKSSYGVNIYALSIQNEPDASVNTYEACQWTGQQIHDFATNLSSALAAKGFGSTKIILPESQNWTDPHNLKGPTLNDPNAAADVSIIADHNYVADNSVGDQTTPAAINTGGKALWETEVALLSGSDTSINNALYWAGRIHLFMTAAQANAWHYWWLVASGNQGLMDTSGNPAKRMYALGQFARFVRPNFYRIGVGSSTGPVQVSAYKDTNSPNFAIVAINSSSMIVTQVFYLANVTGVASVTPWITSATMSLSNQPPVAVSSGTFSYALPALSIVTFTGQSSAGGSLTLSSVADQTINAGVSLAIANAATDPNVPPLTLNFRLLQGPANATLVPDGSGTNAIFNWRPPVSQAGTTNPVSVLVAESGSPNLSATNNFTVTVNPLPTPPLTLQTVAAGQVTLVVNGTQGPDYTLLTTTNLAAGWQALFTSNSPAMPLTLADTNANASAAARFYRIQLGP
jgi:glucuronoarabinoxylan endo-1,4-beta-xylanase